MTLKHEGRFPNHIAFTEVRYSDTELRVDRRKILDSALDIYDFKKTAEGLEYKDSKDSTREKLFKLDDSSADTELYPLFVPSGLIPSQLDLPFTARMIYVNDTLGKLRRILPDMRDEEEIIQKRQTIPSIGWHVRFFNENIIKIYDGARLEIITA